MRPTALLFLFCAAGLVADAATLSADDAAASDAAMQWLQVLDSAKYNDAAEMMAQEIRNQRDWIGYFTKHRTAFGRASKRHLTQVKHTSTLSGVVEIRKYAIIRFKTSFDRGSVAIEEVTLGKLGCCWEVFNYKVE